MHALLCVSSLHSTSILELLYKKLGSISCFMTLVCFDVIAFLFWSLVNCDVIDVVEVLNACTVSKQAD